MAVENPSTKISVGETYGRNKVANITLEDAKFWGRPNFSGELDRFNNTDRQFTILIPNELADQLRSLGWNVKTKIPTQEELKNDPETGPISSLKVKLNFKFSDTHPGDVEYEKGPDVFIKQGDQIEKLTSKTVGILDRARVENIDMELRAWEYDPEEAPGQHSARLVQLVAVLRPNILEEKYGRLR